MIYDVYRAPGPPLTRWQNAAGTVVVCAIIALWVVGTLITRNGDWLDKLVTRSQGNTP